MPGHGKETYFRREIMPRYNIIYKDGDIEKYMHFSSITESPLTNFMVDEDYKELYIRIYSEEAWEKFKAGKSNIMTLGEAINRYNLNKPDYEQLTKKEFLYKFHFYDNKEDK
jgi:hypothetical protein